MTRHEEFVTEEFRHYASECQRLAALARPPQSKAAAAITPPQWGDWIGRVAAWCGKPQHGYFGLGSQAVYS
jgi:hypothetical protein